MKRLWKAFVDGFKNSYAVYHLEQEADKLRSSIIEDLSKQPVWTKRFDSPGIDVDPVYLASLPDPPWRDEYERKVLEEAVEAGRIASEEENARLVRAEAYKKRLAQQVAASLSARLTE